MYFFFGGQNRKHVTFLRVTGYQLWEGHQPITPIQAAPQSLIAKTVSSKGEWTVIFSIGNGSLNNVIFQGSTPEPSSTWFVPRKWLSLEILWPETMWIPSSASCHRLVSNSNTYGNLRDLVLLLRNPFFISFSVSKLFNYQHIK